jgi:hypothetical protein
MARRFETRFVLALVGAALFAGLGWLTWQPMSYPVSCNQQPGCAVTGDKIHTHALLAVALWVAATALGVSAVKARGGRGVGRRRSQRGLMNPIDAVGLWFRRQPEGFRIIMILLLFPIVALWWLAYTFRRGWIGPVDDD